MGFPGGSVVTKQVVIQETTCNTGDAGLIPGSGRSPGEGNGNPLEYSYGENPKDGGVWWATVHGATKSQTRLNTHILTHIHTGRLFPELKTSLEQEV